jgi:hypothetical protein
MARPDSSAGDSDPPLVSVRGTLARQIVHKGTGSEHEAWVIDSPEHGKLILKKLGANPFELGDAPAAPGSKVEAEGFVLQPDLHYKSLKAV